VKAPRIIYWCKNHVIIGTLLTLAVIYVGYEFLSQIFVYSRDSSSRWSYVGTQGGVAFLLALITGTGPSDSIMPAVNRIAGMLCGVAILFTVCAVVGYSGGNSSIASTRTKPTA
jgi:hypothetical protein